MEFKQELVKSVFRHPYAAAELFVVAVLVLVLDANAILVARATTS